jgi:hypothetical protein
MRVDAQAAGDTLREGGLARAEFAVEQERIARLREHPQVVAKPSRLLSPMTDDV